MKEEARKQPSEIMKASAAEIREGCELELGGLLGPTFRDPDSGALFGGPMYSDPDFDFSMFDRPFDGPPQRMMEKGDYCSDCPTCDAMREVDRANGFDVD